MAHLTELYFESLENDFQDLISSPLPFLQGQSTPSLAFRQHCKRLYDLTKSSLKSSKPDPLPTLIINNFDEEQIWGQIELFNKKEAATCLKAADFLIASEELVSLHEDADDIDESEEAISDDGNDEATQSGNESGSEDGFHFEESGDDESMDENIDESKGPTNVTNFEVTEVDDDFFSLRQMEKFLEAEDKKFEMDQNQPSDDDIDYFDDIQSSEGDESSDDGEEDGARSSRSLKYSDYFDEPQCHKNSDIQSQSIATDEQSAFQKHQKVISKKLEAMEEKAIDPAEWQMKGEIKANARPENSLLQETLQFDHVARPPAEITEEHTKTMEDLIKQRILDEAWDDIKRKYKPQNDLQEYKKRILLDSNQSKLTLGEIYEKEYLDQMQKLSKKDVDEKESDEHVAIKKEMEDLFRKLDALSNFHFIASPPSPEIKFITNTPTIEREEVQPVTHAGSQVLAPEEVFPHSVHGEEKSTEEKTSTDKKRDRRKKKLRLKARAKSRLEKLKKLDPESGKVKQIEAMNQLRKASRLPGSHTTIVQGGRGTEKMTSQRFFTKLQDGGSRANKKK